MMLTFENAKILLKQVDIPSIIQKKILLLFLGFGTPSANIIKIECLKLHHISHYDSSVNTLWRFKIWNNNYKILSYNPVIANIVNCELAIAAVNYFQPSNFENSQSQTINLITRNHLYSMFYNLDKFCYGEYGTPTANFIRNAFRNNTI